MSSSDNIKKFYSLLSHEKQTEIRGLDPKKEKQVKKIFVKNEKEFIETCLLLESEGYDVHAGINERKIDGSKDEEVKYLGMLYFDFDAHGDNKLDFAKEQALKLVNDFKVNHISCSMDFSGRGYHIIVPFQKIKLNKSNFDEYKLKLLGIKQHFSKIYGADPNTFNLSRMLRVTGTKNQIAEKDSGFISFSDRQSNPSFLTLLDSIKIENNNPKIVFSSAIEGFRNCKFFEESALETVFPEGNRNSILLKNLSFYTSNNDRNNLRKRFCEKQNMDIQEIKNWDRSISSGLLNVFNCGEIYNYCKKNNLEIVCKDCPYNNFKFNENKFKFSDKIGRKADFFVEKLIYEKPKYNFSTNSNFICEHEYSIFKISFAKGNPSKYVLCKYSSDLFEGDSSHFVRKLSNDEVLYKIFLESPPDENILKEILVKDMGYSEKFFNNLSKENKVFSFIQSKDVSNLEGLFLCLSSGVSQEYIRELSNSDLKQIVFDYLSLGLSIDFSVLEYFGSDFFLPKQEVLDSALFQFSNNHKVIFTDTKAGKSTISRRFGKTIDRVTVSNLLGFSTGDTVNRGSLHNATLPFYIDELQEDKNEQVFGKMLGYMESGVSSVLVGKKAIDCKGYSSLTFMGNPKNPNKQTVNTIEVLEQFDNTLNKITDNYRAIGSRLGIVFFNWNTKKVSGEQRFFGEELDELSGKFDTLRNIASEKFSLLYQNKRIITYLHTPFDKEYIHSLEILIEKTQMNSIKDFLLGNIESFRHLRGASFRLGCLEFLSDLINDKLDVDKLIEVCKQKFKHLQMTNMNSFVRLADSKEASEFFISHYKEVYSSLSTSDKFLVKSIYDIGVIENFKNSLIDRSILFAYMKEHKPEELTQSVKEIINRCNSSALQNQLKIENGELEQIRYFKVLDFSILKSIFENGGNSKKIGDY